MLLKIKNPLYKLNKIKGCTGCGLKEHSHGQIIGFGKIPAQVLFLGEGPNKADDSIGEPFTGLERKIITTIIAKASIMANVYVPSYFLSNIVMCRTWNTNPNDKEYDRFTAPKKQEILACMPNVMEVVRVVNPQFVVFVGKTGETYYKKEFPDSIRITHPTIHLIYGGISSPTFLLDCRKLSEILRKIK